MRQLFLFIVFFISFSVLAIAQEISINEIKTVAINYYFEKIRSFKNTDYESVSVKQVIEGFNDFNKKKPAYYILNMNPDGYVVVSNSYSAKPVLAYSFEGSYNATQKNPSFDSWIRKRTGEIEKLNAMSVSKHSDWVTYQSMQTTKSSKVIPPLVITKWNQDNYYNSFCPVDSAGPDGHVVTGCVATAMAQLMYYHRWPWNGTGSYTYQDPPYGTLHVNFDSSYYDYHAMTPTIHSYNNPASLLMYNIGVSVDMQYGPNGSGMWNHKAAYSFRTYFKYNANTRYIFRDSTSLNWDSIVVANLDARKPLYYAGWEDSTFTNGHAFVCDGYQDHNYYHFNWGWGGYLDGYFYADQLNPGGSNFNYFQELIADIYPDTIHYMYPVYCSDDTLTFPTGTFTSENGNAYYKPNSTCTWVIHPSCGSSVQLQFYSFSLASGDTLFIFDGDNEASPVKTLFTAQNPPVTVGNTGVTTVKSTSNNMFVLFKTDNANEDYGFSAVYLSNYCSTDTLTALSDTVSDGSGDCDYKNSTNCRWIIMPPNSQALRLTFTKFIVATNNNGDFVVIYKNSISSSNTIATLNAQNPPTQSIYIPSGKAIIRFVTNSDITADGWQLYYEDVTGNPLLAVDKSFLIYPNPVNSNSIISLTERNAIVSLYDITGKCLGEINSMNERELPLVSIAPHLTPGVYFLQLNHCSVQKIICIKGY